MSCTLDLPPGPSDPEAYFTTGGLPAEHGLLTVGTPAVAAKQACFFDDPMAGNEVTDGVAADSGTHGPRGSGLPNGLGNLIVTGQLAFRDP